MWLGVVIYTLLTSAMTGCHYLSLHLVRGTAIELFGQSEIRFFHHVVLEHKNIPGRKVTMHDLKTLMFS